MKVVLFHTHYQNMKGNLTLGSLKLNETEEQEGEKTQKLLSSTGI